MKIYKVKGIEVLRSLCLLHQLRSNVHCDPSNLKAKQLNRLRDVLCHAYNNTDFYRGLFDEYNFNPLHIRSVKDLRRLPILEKSGIQNNRDQILSRNHNRKGILVNHTSGSTGVPLKFFTDRLSRAHNRAITYRAYIENGLRPRDVLVQITDPEYRQIPPFWFQKLGIFRLERLSVLDDHTKLFAQINNIRPDAIQCYPSILNLMAQTFERKQLRFRPKLIFTTAELLLPAWRKNISSFFQCDVRDLYGSAEYHRLAWECEKHEGYHLDVDAHVIEFVDKQNNPVEEGDAFVVVTGLFNYVFPLIRYKIGDVARLKKTKTRCSCGRSLPLIDSIQGREDDYIKLPSGKLISPRKIDIQHYVRGVKEYIVTQLRRDLIRIDIVTGQGFTENTIESVRKQILDGCLDEEVNVEVRLVDKITRKTEKARTVVSLVK